MVSAWLAAYAVLLAAVDFAPRRMFLPTAVFAPRGTYRKTPLSVDAAPLPRFEPLNQPAGRQPSQGENVFLVAESGRRPSAAAS